MNKTEKLRNYFAQHQEILLAYIFGSQAGKTRGWRKRPDLDIALLLDEEFIKEGTLRPQCSIWSDLSIMLHRDDIDVVILNSAPPLLQHEVIKNGEVIFERSPDIRIDFEVISELKFYDFSPYRKIFWEAMVKRIKDGKFAIGKH